MNVKKFVFYAVIGLGAFGLISMIVLEPGSLLRMIVTYALIAAVIYGIVRFVMSRRGNSRENSAYKKAVRQSKKKYQPAKPSASKVKRIQPAAQQRKPAKKASAARLNGPKLTVIEGKKGKKKKRMTL
ncbi:SA1362 family protein [Jeotgalibacillus terrae]|uniref:SA1362 family protein n=1 Tax=Jeotgalibacillus terrae TaxID=587735 RepID=A0ABW5ZJJ6_9BACL|nr:SA1362 family protein [Jeotgalibacillus terrae]MBM7577564.1 putative lipid-binding transport protein (Tim44 family) [Jeotgalibacillus terrae]